MVAAHRNADDGVHGLIRGVQPGSYNPAWLLIGDRESLYYVELAADQPPSVRQLSAGIHVLENVALGEPSPKVDRVRSLLSASESAGASRWTAMPSLLADHTVPVAEDAVGSGAEELVRPPSTLASCVHTDDYGTRSSALVLVPSDPQARPEMLVADGPPCTAPFIDMSLRWTT
jgi:uncharacterized protein with NRDE domain